MHTFSMQLKHWISAETKLRFYYLQIQDKEIAYDIEAALAIELLPLIGKNEK